MGFETQAYSASNFHSDSEEKIKAGQAPRRAGLPGFMEWLVNRHCDLRSARNRPVRSGDGEGVGPGRRSGVRWLSDW